MVEGADQLTASAPPTLHGVKNDPVLGWRHHPLQGSPHQSPFPSRKEINN